MPRKNNEVKVPFRSENAFVRKYLAYLDMCAGTDGDSGKGSRRIANTAGFCAYCRITSEEFRLLRTTYPRAYDIMRSHFIDAAVNSKLPNSGPVLDYIIGSVNRFDDEDGSDFDFIVDSGFDEDSF